MAPGDTLLKMPSRSTTTYCRSPCCRSNSIALTADTQVPSHGLEKSGKVLEFLKKFKGLEKVWNSVISLIKS
jgi:hypothetical protein